MFPGSKELRGFPCPKGFNCSFGPDICVFEHSATKDGANGLPSLVALRAQYSKVSSRPKQHADMKVTKSNPLPTTEMRPKILLDAKCKFPWKLRQLALDKIFDALDSKQNAAHLAKSIEQDIYDRAATRQVYSGLFASRIQELRKTKSRIEEQPNPSFPIQDLQRLIHDPCLLERNGYLLAKTDIEKVEEDYEFCCQRCRKKFSPTSYYHLAEPEKCQYHEGRRMRIQNQRVNSCCQHLVGDPGCLIAERHVYCRIPRPDEVVNVNLWDSRKSHLPLVAIDAEMIYTTAGSEIARLSAVQWDLQVIFDVLISPTTAVVDYNTRFSGISAESYVEPGKLQIISFDFLQNSLIPEYIGPDTILVGHSLENDLRVLKVLIISFCSTFIVDIIEAHNRYCNSLPS